MMFIGTLSLNINTHDLNYGAMLHSWAFQRFLIKYYNVNAEVINYITPIYENKNLKYPFIDSLKEGKIKEFLIKLIKAKNHCIRYNKFQNFIISNFIVSKIKYNQKLLEKSKLSYDVIICESDVIWSADFFKGKYDKTFFCALNSMKNTRNIIYAASMANADLSKDNEKELKNLLKDLMYISCRESYAVKYIENLINRKVYHVLDPTLLLKEEDYIPIISRNLVSQKYLLLYMPVGNNSSIINSATEYAKKHNLKIIEISSSLRNILKHKVVANAGIEEFLSLIKNAEIIFSDSFHAVCFSIIFKKQFYAFSRRTGRKIEDICREFDLEERFIKNKFIEGKDINYKEVYNILNKKRKESKKYLDMALNNISYENSKQI